MARRRLLVLATALPLLAAAPPPEGLETDLAFGVERAAVFDGGGDETRWLYRYADLPLSGHVRQRWESGLVVGGQLDLMPAFVSSAEAVSGIEAGGGYAPPRYERGDLALHALFAARVGWHGDWFGLEGGLALPGRPGLPDSPVFLLPTGMLWAGKADLVYAWGRYLYGPGALDTRTAGLLGGLGHNGERLRLLAGAGAEAWLGEAAVRVSPGVRLGVLVTRAVADPDQLDQADLRAQVRITLGHAEIGEQW